MSTSHAKLSPSSAERWIHCPPSAIPNAEAPRKDTAYTLEGTLAHAVGETKARKYFMSSGIGPRQYAAKMKAFKADPSWQDEMDGHTDRYLDALKTIASDFAPWPHVTLETQVDFSEYVPGGYGTADCLMIGKVDGHEGDTLHISDFKYGKGVPVSAQNNPQMKLYALGALLSYGPIYDVRTVRMTIVQPRLREEPDTFETTAFELMRWAEETVRPAAAQAIQGEGEYREGDWCRWCVLRGTCRARAEAQLQLARAEFKLPPELTDEEVGDALRRGQRLRQWLSDLEEYALSACLDGREIDGWKAVAGRSVRAWTDQDAAFDAARAAGIPDEMLWEKKPVTLAGLEKIMGKKPFGEALSAYVTTPPGKPTLVQADDKRPAITNRTTAADDVND